MCSINVLNCRLDASFEDDINVDCEMWYDLLIKPQLEREYMLYCDYYGIEENQENIAGFFIWKKLGMKIVIR
jgi:hypothetical protein